MCGYRSEYGCWAGEGLTTERSRGDEHSLLCELSATELLLLGRRTTSLDHKYWGQLWGQLWMSARTVKLWIAHPPGPQRRGAQLLKMCPSIFSFQAEGAKLMTDQGNWLVQINPAISGFVLQCQNTSSPGCPPSSIAHLSMVPSDFTVNPFMAYGDGFLLAPMAIFK